MLKVFVMVWLCWVMVVPLRSGTKGVVPPVLLTKVEPYTTPATGDVLAESAQVEMTIDSDGTPFALESSGALPNEVVGALMQWRFRPGTKDGRSAAFKMSLTVPIRHLLTPALERSLSQTWSEDALLIEILDLAKKWDPEEVKKRARRLSDQVDQQQMIHGTALLHALFTGTPEQVHEARAEHLLPMIESNPGAAILGSPAALIGLGQEPLADAEMMKSVRELWLKQVAGRPRDWAVLDNAHQLPAVCRSESGRHFDCERERMAKIVPLAGTRVRLARGWGDRPRSEVRGSDCP